MTLEEPEEGVGVYNEFLKEELTAQDARKESFERRGLAVVTTAGTLVTLLFALAALSTKEKATFELPDPARDLLVVALVFFVIAATAALATNVPLRYQAPIADDIRARLKETPVRATQAATKDVALTRVKVLRDAKKKNSHKGHLLFAAIALEVLGVAFVGASMCVVIA